MVSELVVVCHGGSRGTGGNNRRRCHDLINLTSHMHAIIVI